MQHSVWLDDAFDRARQLYLSYYRSIPKSLERSTAHKLMLAMLNGDERFVEPTPHSLQNLTLECVQDAVMSQFVCDNMEVQNFISFYFMFSFSFNVCEKFVNKVGNDHLLLMRHVVKFDDLNSCHQVSIVGDFSEDEIESCILDYLGTVEATKGLERAQSYRPITFRPPAADLQHQQVRINTVS